MFKETDPLRGFRSRGTASLESRTETVRQELTLRLQRVCQHLSTADFDALVLKMTRVQLKGEGN